MNFPSSSSRNASTAHHVGVKEVYIYSSNIFPPKHGNQASGRDHVLAGAWLTPGLCIRNLTIQSLCP